MIAQTQTCLNHVLTQLPGQVKTVKIVSSTNLADSPPNIRCMTANTFDSLGELQKLIDETQVIATTAYYSSHNFLMCFKFDMCVFLEAS